MRRKKIVLGILLLIMVGILVLTIVFVRKPAHNLEEVSFEQVATEGVMDVKALKDIEEAESTETVNDIASEMIELQEMTAAQEEEQKQYRVEKILNSLSLEEKVAQMFFVTPESITGVDRVVVTGDTTKMIIDKYPVGGLVYFASNLVSPEQTKDMLCGVQDYVLQKQKLPIFLGVDEEGGRVLRIGNNETFGVAKVEAMGVLAAKKDSQIIYEAGNTIGAYLKELGFNVDFAPDTDVLTNQDNVVIGDRSFGTNADVVADMAWVYSEGLHDNGILACYKHFPGHGGTVEDSHNGYAYSYKTIEELQAVELVPFQSGCDKGIDFIMVSHISTPEITGSDVPASLSEILVTEVLRNGMGYQGIIITDSLSMGAICNHYDAGEVAVLAVQAGCDMLLMPQNFYEAYNALLEAVEEGTITEERIDVSLSRIIRAKLELMGEEIENGY